MCVCMYILTLRIYFIPFNHKVRKHIWKKLPGEAWMQVNKEVLILMTFSIRIEFTIFLKQTMCLNKF